MKKKISSSLEALLLSRSQIVALTSLSFIVKDKGMQKFMEF